MFYISDIYLQLIMPLASTKLQNELIMVNNVKSIRITINQYCDAYSRIITKRTTNKLI